MPDDLLNQADPLEPAAPTPPAPPGGGQSNDPTPPGGAAPETFSIDGQTLTADQVRDALKAKADYDRLNPEFTRKSQLLSDPEKLREYVSKQFPDRFKFAPETPPTPEEAQLDNLINAAKDRGQLLTRDEAMKMWDEQRQLDTLTNSFKTEIENLGKEWDGQGGKPKFDLEAVQKHMLENGFPTLKSAFTDLNEPALREWYATQKPKPTAPVVAAPGGGTVPVAKDKPLSLDSPEFDEAADKILGEG